jgi:nucleotide-binding universal stress UspA family protein
LGYRWAKVETKVLVGSVANSLVEYVKEGTFDLVVIATHGRSGPGRWVWGSTADRLLRSSCIPVFMMRVPGCVPDMD